MSFSSRIDRYDLVELDGLDRFKGWAELPPGYEFVGEQELDRDAERALLQSEFPDPDWERPFYRRMPGYLPEGVVGVTYAGELVGIAYLCTENDCGVDGYAQLHYAVVRADHRGRGLYRAIVSEIVKRLGEHGSQWMPNLKGITGETDREGLRVMYERWGAEFVSETPKRSAST
jgi:GNAT superfamily N-acetyltransferase